MGLDSRISQTEGVRI